MSKRMELDRHGRSTLDEAVVHGSDAEVRELVQRGADVRLADRAGFTPLHFAAQEQRAELVTLLVSAGAVTDARDSWGNTPLFRAVFNCQGGGETIVALLAEGADPDAANDSGVSPRELAARVANFDVKQFIPE